MPEYSVFPDAEAVCGSALQVANTSGLGKRVYSSFPSNVTNASFPLAIVQRLGGQPVEKHRIDQARIQLDVYGLDKASARDAADQARIVLHEMEGQAFPLWDAFVTNVDDEVGPSFLPDYDTGRDRYVFSVLVTLHTTAD